MPDRPSPRVASLIPSATEIVAGLGMLDHLVGVSHECDHPPAVRTLPALCSAKLDPERSSVEIDRDVRALVQEGLSVYDVDVEGLRRLQPDVIVTQDHCEVCAVSLSTVEEALGQLDLPGTRICALDPRSLEDVRADFRSVAAALGVPERGDELVRTLDARLEGVRRRVPDDARRPRVALLEWLVPPMVAGGWMPELARIAGGEPVIVETAEHFAEVDWDTLARADPDVVVVLPCGFDVPRSLAEMQDDDVRRSLMRIPAVGRGDCVVVDGNAYFNRPGPRLAESVEVLAGIVHPEAFADFRERYASVAVPWTAQARVG